MGLRKLILALAALSLCAPRAQALDPAVGLALHDLRIWQDGLPQQSINVILQARNGYLWLGTFEGLVRFNGVEFKVFDERSLPGMLNPRVRALVEDPDGTLWIGTLGGLTRLRDDSAITYGTEHGLPGNAVQALLRTRSGTLWVATATGLGRMDGERFRGYTMRDGLPHDGVRALAEDRAGRVWVGTDAGLVRLEGERFVPVPLADGLVQVATLVAARDGSMLVGTRAQGLFRVSGDTVRHWGVEDGLPTTNVPAVLEDSRGALWAGTSCGGLARLYQDRWETLTTAGGLPGDCLWSLAEDHEGSVWVGTSAGVARLADLKFQTWTKRAGLSENNVRVTLQGRDGSLWVGTDGGGLDRIRDGQVTAYGAAEGLPNPFIRSLFEDPDGTLWVGTHGGGLARFRDGGLGAEKRSDEAPMGHAPDSLRRVPPVGRFTVFSTKDGLPNEGITAIQRLHDGTLVTGTFTGPAYAMKDGRFAPFLVNGQPTPWGVVTVHEDREGTLWIGTYDQGLVRVSHGETRVLTVKNGAPSDSVFAVTEDGDGNLWIATNAGISRYKDGRFQTATTAMGLFDNAAFNVIDDRRGSLWLTSNRGLTRVDRRSLIDALEGRRAHVDATLYGRTDGLGSNQCNGVVQPSSTRLADGRLAIATAGGLTLVDPAHITTNTAPPPVVVAGVLVDGRPLPADGVLPWSSRRFELHYDGLSYLVPERVTFRYLLEGLDTDWVDAGTRRVALYNSLPPGDYTWRVQARNNDGVWNEAGASVRLSLPPPPWRRWWAMLLAGLSGVLLLTLGVHVRERVLRRQNRLLEQRVRERTAELAAAEARANEANRAKSVFLANMSHELRTPLNAVIGFAQVLERHSSVAGRDRESLRIIQRSGEHLLGLINDVLSLSRIEAGRLTLVDRPFELRALFDSVRDIMRERAEARGLQLDCELDPGLPAVVIGDAGRLRQVLLNLLGNAVKFTEHGRVALRARWQAGRAEVEVEDTGIGIAERELPLLFEPFVQTESGRRSKEGTGLGLVISRQIVQLMGGDITVESTPGQGTRFRFEAVLPVSGSPALQAPARRVIGLAPGQVPPRILVVDDTDESRLLLVKLLTDAGFDVREARHGGEALEEWRAWAPALVWMDMRMPVMDGREATRAIRAEEKAAGNGAPRTRIVALTASAFEHEREAILADGADDFVLKPFRLDTIFETLARGLGVRLTYDDEDDGDPAPSLSVDVLTVDRIRGLPEPRRQELLHALRVGDVAEAERAAEAVRPHDAVLARALGDAVRGFRLDELLSIFERV